MESLLPDEAIVVTVILINCSKCKKQFKYSSVTAVQFTDKLYIRR